MSRAVVALAVLLVPAMALPCSRILRLTEGLAPSPDSTDVPLNAEVKYISRQETTWTLVDGAGAAVPATAVKRGPLLTAIRPLQQLAPNRRYTLTVTSASDSTETVTAAFTTGTRVDSEAPAPLERPKITSVAGPIIRASSCDGPGYLDILWTGASDDHTPARQLMIEAVLSTENGSAELEPDLTVLCTRVADDQGCRMFFFPTDKSEPQFMRGRAVDWAGNMTELTASEPLRGCGCSSGSGALALLALAVLRRRGSTGR